MNTAGLPDLVWAVTDAKGAPVTTLAGLADTLGVDTKDAATALLDGPFAGCAPEPLLVEARDLVDGKDSGSKPPIGVGSFVSWSGGRGRVDLIVTNGSVPGVGADSDVTGTADDPAARVVVYDQAGGVWKATTQKVAVKTTSLTSIPPIMGRAAKKSMQDELQDLRAEQEALVDGRGLGEDCIPTTHTLLAVYERGVKAWPGSSHTELTAREWAVGRARAFCSKALGEEVAGYVRDDDLLPGAHANDAAGAEAPSAADGAEEPTPAGAVSTGAGPAGAPVTGSEPAPTDPAHVSEEASAEGKSATVTPAELMAVLERFPASDG